MPVSRVFITRFFQLVTERRFAEAERMAERSKKRARKNEWNKGYFHALSGILLAQKSNDDRYLFLPSINPTNEDELKEYRRNFLKHTRNTIHADYDRGFFSAWNDYIRTLLKLRHRRESKKEKKTIDGQPTQTEFRTQMKSTKQTKLL